MSQAYFTDLVSLLYLLPQNHWCDKFHLNTTMLFCIHPQLDYCDKILRTPAVLMYQNPETKEVEIFGTGGGKSFIQKHSYILTRFDCHLGAAGK